MKEITGNVVDVVARQTYAAKVLFSKTIVEIERVADSAVDGLPYLMPGFVDSHVHIESSMLTPQRFAEMVVPHGTVAAVCDPHEIANVLGLRGVQFMMDDAQKSPLGLYFAIPSCVPATPFETNGADFGVREMERIIEKGVALGEMMNYPGVIGRLPFVMEKIEMAHKHGRPVDGHIPGIVDERLDAYAAAGISTDHESFSLAEAEAKIARGMKILVREGSAARNLEALMPLFHTHMGSVMACTDDAHPDDIAARGHMDKFFRALRADGVDLFDVYRALLLNPAEHYRLPVGRLQKGDRADFLVVADPDKLDIRSVFLAGKEVYEAEKGVLFAIHSCEKVNNFIERTFCEEDFVVRSTGSSQPVSVIGLVPDQLVSEHLKWVPGVGIVGGNVVARADDSLAGAENCLAGAENRLAGAAVGVPAGQEIEADAEADIMKIAVVNRYKKAPVANGFIRGTGLKGGALAASIAHDSHNVVVVGRTAAEMKRAAERVFAMKGGVLALSPDGAECSLRLPVAGLMTTAPHHQTARKYEKLVRWAREKCGVTLASPFMTMSFMCLLVIPSLKIGDRGLFDVDRFAPVE